MSNGIQGDLIFQSRDDYGCIEVRDHGGRRSLYLGSATVQSAIYLHDPLTLALTYTKAMLSFALLQPAPACVLLLGLGGGSIAGFILRHFSGTRIDVVELRPAVISVARNYFGLGYDQRLRLYIDDASHFLLQSRNGLAAYDAILVDAYDGAGPAAATCDAHFPTLCAQRLTPKGVAVFNLWSAQRSVLEAQLRSLSATFPGNVATLPVPKRGNIIALAGPAVASLENRGELARAARYLKHAWHIDLPEYLRRISLLQEPSWRRWLRRTGLGALAE